MYFFEAYLRKNLSHISGQGPQRRCRCPDSASHANGDRDPSASVNLAEGVINCHGCGLSGNVYQIAKELNWDPPPEREGASITRGLRQDFYGQPIKKHYAYKDENGQLRYYVCRVESHENGERRKDFPVQDANGRWGLNAKPGVRDEAIEKIPYRLDELAEAEEVFIAEGEKDVDALRDLGLVATCNPGGAGKWRPEYSQYLKDKRVVVLADNDQKGLDHAEDVVSSLQDFASSIKLIEFPELETKGDVSDWLERYSSIEDAVEAIAKRADACEELVGQQNALENRPPEFEKWELFDLACFASLDVDPVEWIVEGLIPEGSIGFLSGAPKDGKSLLTLDLTIHLALGLRWLDRFQVKSVKVLYVAREDPLQRLKERVLEINTGLGDARLPENMVDFLVRERFELTKEQHIDWLKREAEKRSFQFLILDVVNRMIPGLDEISAKDMGEMVRILEDFNRDCGLTILLLDHTRKGQGGVRHYRRPDPFDLKGSVAKYGAADFMLCLGRTPTDGQLALYCENKDTDQHQEFYISVSPKGSGEKKFRYAGDVAAVAKERKEQGERNCESVLAVLKSEWETSREIAGRVEFSQGTVRSHLNTLEKKGLAERKGTHKSTRWRKTNQSQEPSKD